MARMSIDDKFLRDARVVMLGRRFGWSRRETMGALLDVYQVTHDRESEVLPEAEVDAAADRDGFSRAMIELGLADNVRAGVRINSVNASPTPVRWITYAIEATGCFAVKVGRTTDLDRRVAELQKAHHSKLEVFGVVPGDVEQAIHRELDLLGKRRRGEWFDLDARTELVLADHGIGRA